MIEHLKEMYNSLYLPIDSSTPTTFEVKPITEPYLYTEANVYVDTFEKPNQSVKIKVSNVGDGKLYIERVRIPRGFEKWIKRAEGSKPVTLSSSSEPIEFELKLNLAALPNPSSINVVKLSVISNSKRKTFSDILLGVQSPNDQPPNLTLPDYINFGEISVYKITIKREREDAPSPAADFLLIGDFTQNPPSHISITQTDEFTFETNIYRQKGELNYILDLRKPGSVMPGQQQTGITLKRIQKTISISNVGSQRLFKEIPTSETEWLTAPSHIDISGYDTDDLPVFVNVAKLKPGRNVGELILDDTSIAVWVWYKIAKETSFTIDKDKVDFHYVQEFPEQEGPLSVDMAFTEEPYQSVMIFEDTEFQFPLKDGGRIGYLIGEFNQWTPHTMFLEKREKHFGITLSVSEGAYLYRAEIDGEMRLDPARLFEVVCCKHGLASKIKVKRVEQQLTLRNRTKQKLEIKLKSTTEWLRIKPEIAVLPARKKSNITAVIHPDKLVPGLNQGWLHLETTKKPIKSLQVPIYVFGVTKGVVPRLKNEVLTFPEMEQGNSERIPLELEIIGQGELKGEVQPSTVLRFAGGNLKVQNDNIYEPKTVHPPVEVVMERPSNAYRNNIGASLITDCYLANLRVHGFEAKYEMTHLLTDPPALYFPKVYLFDTPKQANVAVKRSDGKVKVLCDVEISDELTQSGLLSIESDGGQCSFILNPQAATNAGRISDIITFTDRKSGMSLPIQFAADMIDGQSEIDVKKQKHFSNNILLSIKNIGETDLRVFDVSFKYQRFYLTPSLSSQQRTILPGESIERNITLKPSVSLLGKKTVGIFRKATVRDTLIVRLNDPQYPNGVFEKEIVAEIKGRFQ